MPPKTSSTSRPNQLQDPYPVAGFAVAAGPWDGLPQTDSEVTMEFKTCLIVALGGAIGTVSRYALATLTVPISQSLPWGTILINILGSMLIGFFGTLTLAHGRYPVPETARLFVMVGICGGFTTFSSFSLQTLDLLRAGAMGRAGINIAASVVLCLCAVAIGHVVAARLNGGAVSVVQLPIEEEA